MKTHRLLLIPLLLLFVAQLAVPLWQVWQEENIRREGLAFKLALQPVDPYDIMRGRYLALGFPAQENGLPVPTGSMEGDTVYAVLETDANGLAHVTHLSTTPLDNAFAVPLVTRLHFPEDGSAAQPVAEVHIPLTRFYLPEDDAIAIDELWRWRTDDNNPNIGAALGVRVKDGRIVAETLWLNGQPYRDWLREQAARSSTENSSSSP